MIEIFIINYKKIHCKNMHILVKYYLNIKKFKNVVKLKLKFLFHYYEFLKPMIDYVLKI